MLQQMILRHQEQQLQRSLPICLESISTGLLSGFCPLGDLLDGFLDGVFALALFAF
jgi:hypothetical protein